MRWVWMVLWLLPLSAHADDVFGSYPHPTPPIALPSGPIRILHEAPVYTLSGQVPPVRVLTQQDRGVDQTPAGDLAILAPHAQERLGIRVVKPGDPDSPVKPFDPKSFLKPARPYTFHVGGF